MAQELINLILVNYGSMSHTLACLKSVSHLGEKLRIFIVDNKSSENPVAFLQGNGETTEPNTILENWLKNITIASAKEFSGISLKLVPGITLISNPINSGYAAAVNIVLRKLINESEMSEFVWFLNNDTRVKSDTLRNLLEVIGLSGPNGFVSSTLYYLHDENQIQSRGCGILYKPWLLTRHCTTERKKFDFLVGTSMLTSIAFLRKIGLYPEEYFLYYEDVAYSLLAKKSGGYLRIAEKSVVLHAEGGSDKTEVRHRRSSIVDFYLMRNRMVLAQRFFPYYVPFVMLSLTASLLKRLFKGDFMKAYGLIRIIAFQPFHAHNPIKPG